MRLRQTHTLSLGIDLLPWTICDVQTDVSEDLDSLSSSKPP